MPSHESKVVRLHTVQLCREERRTVTDGADCQYFAVIPSLFEIALRARHTFLSHKQPAVQPWGQRVPAVRPTGQAHVFGSQWRRALGCRQNAGHVASNHRRWAGWKARLEILLCPHARSCPIAEAWAREVQRCCVPSIWCRLRAPGRAGGDSSKMVRSCGISWRKSPGWC